MAARAIPTRRSRGAISCFPAVPQRLITAACSATPRRLCRSASETGNKAVAQVGGYMEEVRRQLIDQFGETPEDGPLSVYGGGLGCAPL